MPSPVRYQSEQISEHDPFDHSGEDVEQIDNMDDRTIHISQEDDIDDNEDIVKITSDKEGRIIPQGNQLCDYLHRGNSLTDICVWEFFSQVQKVTKTSINTAKNKKGVETNEDLDDNFLCTSKEIANDDEEHE